jgi:hypothetical protein
LRRLKKFDPKRWLPTLTIAWGVAAALQGLVGSQRGFYAARFCACAPPRLSLPFLTDRCA